jgi:microcystin-dependent protein
VNELPSHRHDWKAFSGPATGQTPINASVASPAANFYDNQKTNLKNMNPAMVSNTGGSRSHTNYQPFLCVHYIIALFGIYPSRH